MTALANNGQQAIDRIVARARSSSPRKDFDVVLVSGFPMFLNGTVLTLLYHLQMDCEMPVMFATVSERS